MKVFERQKCRASNGKLIPILNLGNLPFSCFPQKGDPLPKLLPLELCFNEESGLVQLKHTVDPDAMYSEYWYMSGVNQSMPLALQSIVHEAMKRLGKGLNEGDIVVDIASNDGTLLSAYPTNLYRIGIDPAKNIKPKSCDLHINTYFSAKAYKAKMGDQRAELVTSIAMFYDLEDPIQFAKDVGDILQPGGIWVIELSYLPTMLKQNSFDTICSEHLEYYSLKSIEYILQKAGLGVEDIEFNNVNGGSFRLYIRHQGFIQETPAVEKTRQDESGMNLTDPQTYVQFASQVEKNKHEMIAFLTKQKELGKKVIGYGASTKGNTILAYYGITKDLLPFIADRNPIKWGRNAVTGIPIISEDEARKMNPDFFLAFPYHFMGEFVERERDFIRRGGKFVSPIPKLTLLPE